MLCVIGWLLGSTGSLWRNGRWLWRNGCLGRSGRLRLAWSGLGNSQRGDKPHGSGNDNGFIGSKFHGKKEFYQIYRPNASLLRQSMMKLRAKSPPFNGAINPRSFLWRAPGYFALHV